MANTRQVLERIGGNLDESLGVREHDLRPKLSPVSQGKDAGRRPLRNVGSVDIHMVIPDPDQPRVEFSEEALERLAESIRDNGQLSPIWVRWSEPMGKWMIVAGERRWRATKRAGLLQIDCRFHDGDISRSEILEQQLIENLLREDLQPIEQAKAFSMLLELNGWTGKQLAEALRVPPSSVSRALALLRLPDDVQEQVAAGAISARSAYELPRLDDESQMRPLAEKAAAGMITHEQAANAVRQRKGKPKSSPRGTRQTFLDPEGWRIVISLNRRGTY
ncbi:MAG: ParB/RepB/Spo0J family partition protein, partial [Planctomycetes bacterium]|nr:ParB/RepB/Spo0J family partition protein [Planctomycetota bacterium]